MYVIKRNGKQTPLLFDKITQRNQKLANDLPHINTESLSQSVIAGLKSGMTTHDIDVLSCENAIHKSIYEPDYGILASRIAWNDLHKRTPETFKETIEILYNNKNKINGKPNPLIHPMIYEFALKHIERIEKEIDYKLDEEYSYFSFRIQENSYLQKVDGKTVERGQSMLMRVALGIHGPSKRNGIIHEGDIEKVVKTYKMMAHKKATHATPTLFNSGTIIPQLSSCFLLSMPDSMGDSTYDEDENLIMNPVDEVSIPTTWKHMAKISKAAGGIGVDVTRLRCTGSIINGTNGRSTGLINPITVINRIATYVDQGGKRKGAISVYVEPWHPDTPEVLEVGLKATVDDKAARNIFPAMWIPDLFFKRLEENGEWSFFCPNSHPELITLYGEDFEKRYTELENEKKYCRRMKADELWTKICRSIDETGLPYMLSKDAVNKKTNHQNVGTITSSNLCCEIVQYHNPQSIGVCNLASICLPQFVSDEGFDFDGLGETVRTLVDNLNLVIDKTYYPVKECAINNFQLRPMAIGIQGLADIFAMFTLPWGDETALKLDRLVFEHMYFYALLESVEQAKKYGYYEKFPGSPLSKGILQYHMWTYQNPRNPTDPKNNTPILPYTTEDTFLFGKRIKKLDWEGLINDIKTYGVRNSLLIAPMPTQSTSSIFNCSEGIDPYNTNVFTKKVLSGTFPVINKHLYKELSKIGMWNKETVDLIIKDNGSVANLDIPQRLKDVFKTVWEMSQIHVIDAAANRGPFIDQTQSMNICISRPTKSKLSSMYLYSWKKGLKTLSYYTRSDPAALPQKFSIMNISEALENNKREKEEEKQEKQKTKGFVCDGDVCMACSS